MKFVRTFLSLPAALLAACLGIPPVLFAAEHHISSAEELKQLKDHLNPGDVVYLKDGTWSDPVEFHGEGTVEQPIVFRPETPGKVLFSGSTSITIDGTYLVANGFEMKGGRGFPDGIAVKGNHCRVTNSSVTDSTYKFFIHLYGTEDRMDHCYLAGKTSDAPTLQIEAPGPPNHDLIDYNHFGPRPPLRHNGGETMRVGYSWQSMNSSGTTVEHNLFDRCDGEIEIISSKSCDNIYRFNTFRNCGGMLTLRHGNRCVVDSNFFFGEHKRGSGGIRVIGENHLIVNNYIEGVMQGAFWITSGIPDSPLRGYFQAKNCLIAFNTVTDSPGPVLELDAGIGSSHRTLRPTNIVIANNAFWIPGKESFFRGKEGEGFQWLGNFVQSNGENPAHVGIQFSDAQLIRANDGMLRPGEKSPLRASAEGTFPAVQNDADGQPRKTPADAGCDQSSEEPITNHPLKASEVGPEWMTRPEPS